MASKKQIMDKLSALNPSVPTKTRVAGAAAQPVVEIAMVAEAVAAPAQNVVTVVEAKPQDVTVVAEIAPPVFSDAGVCTFTLFLDNMAAMMRISEEIQRNFLSINAMMIDSYQKTLTISFDSMTHNYGQFVESLKLMIPRMIHR
ncbi:MAG: hypothetical protein HQK97_10615 [Nitrospirae bacterium]|nr:hypothetical protein [Nitrospirota bacterium]